MGVSEQVEKTTKVFVAILTMGLMGLIFLIVFGNLSGNLGFTANSQGANDTDQVIGNLTGGARDFFSFSNVWFTLLAVVLLIIIAISVIRVIGSRNTGGRKDAGPSFSS